MSKTNMIHNLQLGDVINTGGNITDHEYWPDGTDMIMKVCRTCGVALPLTEFRLNKIMTFDSRRPDCVTCEGQRWTARMYEIAGVREPKTNKPKRDRRDRERFLRQRTQEIMQESGYDENTDSRTLKRISEQVREEWRQLLEKGADEGEAS